jgi:hypothetical protein
MKSTPQSPNALRQSRPHSLTVAEGMATWTTGIRPVSGHHLESTIYEE